MIGIGAKEPVGHDYWLVAGVTLMTTVGLNVWGRGQAKLLCTMVGILVGYGLAVLTGVLPQDALGVLSELRLFAIPHLALGGWAFSPDMILPFTVAALAVTLKGIGDITALQRINDAGWVRAEMGSISRGTLANGLGQHVRRAGRHVGAHAVDGQYRPAGGDRGQQPGHRICRRRILLALAFLPSVTGSLILMPRPVMGAALLFSACFVLISGLQTITSRMLDARRTIVIGLGISSGVAAELIPSFATDIPHALQPIVSSSIVLGTTTALLLNGLFRIGQRQRVKLALDPAAPDAVAEVNEFFDTAGRGWGARPRRHGPRCASASTRRSRPFASTASRRGRSRSKRTSTSSTSM
jgi:NCS2 family nucleobase:cation symporter-2